MKIAHVFADKKLESRGIKFVKFSKIEGIEIETYLKNKKEPYFLYFCKTLTRLLKSDANIIHAHRISGFLPAMFVKILKPKIRVIYDKHDIHKYDFLFDRLMFFADYVIVCSDMHLKSIRKFHKRSIIIPNYSDFKKSSKEKIKKIRSNLQIKKEEILVLFQGSIVPNYGLDMLVDVVPKLDKKIIIGIIGWIKDKGYWEKIKKNLGKRIRYFGVKEYEEMKNYISAADVGVVLFQESKLTKFGNPAKLFEFIACKIPVIVTNIESISKYIKRYKNGIIVKNEEELAKALNKMSDRKIRKDFSRKSPDLSFEKEFKDKYLPLIRSLKK